MPDSPVQVLCFAHAGGGVAHFHRWRRQAPDGLDLIPVCLPGRESRYHEPLYRNLEAILDDIDATYFARLSPGFLFFGHSMGGLISYELAARWSARGKPPGLLCVAACRSPDMGPDNPPLHVLPDEQLVDALKTVYGGQQNVMENLEARRVFLPIIRADLQAIETFRSDVYPPLDCPIAVMHGTQDPSVPSHYLTGWHEYSTDEVRMIPVAGDHFFVQENRDLILSCLDGYRAARER